MPETPGVVEPIPESVRRPIIGIPIVRTPVEMASPIVVMAIVVVVMMLGPPGNRIHQKQSNA